MVFLGYDKINLKRQSFGVNQKGFISMYGLLLLSVFSLFLAMLAVRVKAFYTSTQISLSDVFVLHHVQDQLILWQEKKTTSTSEGNEHEEKQETNLNNEEASSIETQTYQQCSIQFAYQQKEANVAVQCPSIAYTMTLFYDREEAEIIKYEYNKRFMEE